METISASFVPPKTGSAVRLFNLAFDVPSAGLQNGAGKQLTDQVQYTLGSVRVDIIIGNARTKYVRKSQSCMITR